MIVATFVGGVLQRLLETEERLHEVRLLFYKGKGGGMKDRRKAVFVIVVLIALPGIGLSLAGAARTEGSEQEQVYLIIAGCCVLLPFVVYAIMFVWHKFWAWITTTPKEKDKKVSDSP